MSEVLRIGNCSGFYGDRLSAMREMLDGGPLDVLTGDYLAELTMLILGKDTMKDPSLGYARTFVRQVEECLGDALERGVRIVSNAGGLNPAGLAERLGEVARGLGLDPVIAHVEGDDLRPLAGELGWSGALTANAYLGGFGIAAALREGADVVVTGRVTDASLVVGPAAARFDWEPTAYDALAGAVVVGHVLECGTQATGGNFSGFAPDPRPLGFPLAEIASDGSAVITKHADTGGQVSVDTVTAQLFYEIQSARYLGPDVTTDLDSIRLEQEGPDRVRISGVVGEAPPETLKVCLNELGGWRNTMEFVVTGLEQETKESWLRGQLDRAWGPIGEQVTWTRGAPGVPGADTEEGASTLLRATIKTTDAAAAGKGFTAPAVEVALASYPGFTLTAPPGPATPYGIYRPEYVSRDRVQQRVVTNRGQVVDVPDPGPSTRGHNPGAEPGPTLGGTAPGDFGPRVAATVRRPLGTFVHARSGDKGGDANLGLWIGSDGDPRREARIAWLLDLIHEDTVRALVPEAAGLQVEIHPLPHLGGVNVLLRGLLGDGVAASTRFDPQAKALGEWVRSREVDIPEDLL